MASILPSEIARLVFGYLEENNCKKAAKLFLEDSPDLKECSTIVAQGKKFSVKLNGSTLFNIVETFFFACTLMEEKLSSIENANIPERGKQTDNFIEQLKYFVDERYKYFLVNNSPISNNVSSDTPPTSVNSPIIASSVRKRKYNSPSDKKEKRHQKSNFPVDNKQEEEINNGNYETVETTSLDQLPGHSKNSIKSPKKYLNSQSTIDKPVEMSKEVPGSEKEIIEKNLETQVIATSTLPENQIIIQPSSTTGNQSQSCSTGTDTKELFCFTTTGAQTSPFNNLEYEDTNEAIQNLGILSTELCLRPQIHEKIAENINNDYLRDSSLLDMQSDCNISVNTQVNNMVASIVDKTNKDPEFERLIHEFIIPDDAEKSPDEEEQSDEVSNELRNEENRNLNVGEAVEKPVDNVKKTTTLDDENAAAIMSIINVNAKSESKVSEEKVVVNRDNQQREEAVEENEEDVTIVKTKLAKKQKKTRGPKPNSKKRNPPVDPSVNMEIIEMPGLIVMDRVSNPEPVQGPSHSMPSGPISIVPKGTIIPSQPRITQPLCLKAMNLKVATPVPRVSNNLPTQTLREIVAKPQLPQIATVGSQVIQNTVEVIESMTLYGNENTAKTIIPINQMSPIHIEDSVNVSESSFSMSPFIKFDRLHGKAQEKPEEKKEDEVVEAASTSTTTHNTAIIKHTPKSLLKSRQNNHRLSLSTPRKRINHVRALDFNTPSKGLNSSRRLSDANNSRKFTPSTLSLSKSSFRTSLFKSPNYPASPSGKKIKSPVKVNRSPLCKIPIATRGLEPKLTGGWEKYTGVGLIIESKSSHSSSSFSSPEKQLTKSSSAKPVNTINKKCWDADLRASLIIADEPVESKAEARKRRIANAKAKKGAQLAASEEKEIDIDQDKSEIPVIKKCLPVEEETSPSTESVTQNNKSVTKKYVKLKTLTTTVTTRKEQEKTQHISPELAGKSGVFSKINAPRILPSLGELETPIKFDNFGIPPTPQLLSPSNSNVTLFCQLSDDSRKIQGPIPTPEFPPTPNIAITPKQLSNNTIDATKDGNFTGSSSYYHPSGEMNAGKSSKSTNKIIAKPGATGETTAIISSTIVTSVNTEIKSSTSTSTAEVNYHQNLSTNVTNKMEITQFEVIKDNLSREDAFKELKMSSSKDINSSESQQDNHTSIDKTETSSIVSQSKSMDTSGTTADDSSDSDSDSSSSSSGSSNSSCSSCMDDTNTSSRKCKKTPTIDNSTVNKFSQLFGEQESDLTGMTKNNSALESVEKSVDKNFREKNDASPTKVFPIVKTDEMLLNADMETPAKDDALVEADIGETPSSSKVGVESLTNLSSKISALTEDNGKVIPSFERTQVKTGKPIIVSVETIKPGGKSRISEVLGGVPLQKTLNLRDPAADAKLSAELEEKRLRVKNKLDAPTKPPPKRAPKKVNNPVQRTEKKQLTTEVKKLPELPVAKVEKKTRVSRISVKQQQQQIVEKTSDDVSIPKTEKIIPTLVVATRKSLRNAEKNAKRGLSEPRDKSNVVKQIEPERKAQSSREPSDDVIIDKNIFKPIEIGNNLPLIETEIDDTEVTENQSKEKIKVETAEVVGDNKNLMVNNEEKKGTEAIKSKVEMVKRDLFSDDEQSDQRTTRSRSRQISETQKGENSAESRDNLDVLECLQLIPANKSMEEQNANTETDSYEHMEISFIYDDTVPTKKRRRKYSNSELECRIQVEGNDGEEISKLLTASPYEELFSMSPVRQRKRPTTAQTKSRAVKEKIVPTIVRKRRAPIKLKNTKSVASTIESQPLATSSPLQDNTLLKSADKVKQVSVTIDKIEPEKIRGKTRKRKISDAKDNTNNPADNKKPRAAPAPGSDPPSLLKKMNLVNFLTAVHGPE